MSALTVTILMLGHLVAGIAPSAARPIAPDTACRNGKVALTFDDGPHKVYTPRLLAVLRKHRAQATFFVTGVNATKHPKILRAMVRDGHAVEVHSWDHPDLTSRPKRSVKRQLRLTRDAIRRAIGQQPKLYRPPYGATERRIRKIAKSYGLREVLWTIDSNDWRGGSTTQIRKEALRGLRKHRQNVILMHDAVDNSPRTIKAVPAIIKGLRKKGYCLVPLERMMPLNVATVKPQTFVESVGASHVVRVKVRLDGPAQRDGEFRVRTVDGTAHANVDFRPINRVVTVLRGDRSASFGMRILGDPQPNLDKQLTLRLDQARGLRLASRAVPVTIRDDGSWAQPAAELIAPLLGRPARVQS